MARLDLGQSISKTLVGSKEGTVVNRRLDHGWPRLTDARGERRLSWFNESCFLFYHVDGSGAFTSLTCGTHGTRMHYGKKTSRWRQCSAGKP